MAGEDQMTYNGKVPIHGKYHSHKGFCTMNIKVIADKNKKILWRYIRFKGFLHNSLIFHLSCLG